jgi:hypothetical protein
MSGEPLFAPSVGAQSLWMRPPQPFVPGQHAPARRVPAELCLFAAAISADDTSRGRQRPGQGTRLRMVAARLATIILMLTCLCGCSFGLSPDSLDASTPSPERRDLPGHVYLLRGLIGDVFSLGMDDLAAKIQKRGVKASVHGVSAARFLADDIARKYRDDPALAPIMLIGHSTGGDEIIVMAERLKAANVPVALAVAFDPTPIAGAVPSNVDLFINLYQATNLIGGGRATPARGFRGRLVNVDLRERREIVHITLDKSPVIHALLTEKIVGIAEQAAERRDAARASRSEKIVQRRDAATSDIRPLTMKYVVPADARIELWDSATIEIVGNDDTLAGIAARTGAPAWAIAQINNLDENAPLESGRKLMIPRNSIAPARGVSEGSADTAIGAARVRASRSVR